jgi:hypothetical protein
LNNTSLEALNTGAAVNPCSQRKKEKLERVRIGISSCLLGERVHFDGGLAESIESHRRGLIPLIVPVTLIRHYVRKYEVTYLEDQVYLNPHPNELMLLNEL